jgi:CubicO group peptidase (beta-lactamase class C family)
MIRWTLAAASLVLAAVAAAPAPERGGPRGWPTAKPAEVGLDETALAAFDAEIAAGKYGHVDALLVIRHGRLAYDRAYGRDYRKVYGAEAAVPGPLNPHDPSGPYNYFNPWWHPYYRGGDLHTMQSVTKTVTSMVVGAATGRGEFPSLDRPVLSFFDAAAVANADQRKKRMTLRHLLTMTAGLDWREDLPYADPNNTAMTMEASFDWVKYTIDRPMAHEPGATFQYNSGATQLLAHVFRKATGHDIEEYAARHLFAPLGIARWFWKRSPSGLADTEGGLYLTVHDMAKLPQLYLQGGTWNGRAIVPADWVKASVTPAIAVPGPSGIQYGYKWWLQPYGAGGRLAWAGSGFGGQRPIAVPEHDLVLAVTGWNILPDGPSLAAKTLIDRVVQAIRPVSPPRVQ